MLVAIFKGHWSSGFSASRGLQYPLALLTMALAVLLAGSGRLSSGDWEAWLTGSGATTVE
jgi:uncharacterized membrane protein YphA (DoxX/SURF4 family)